MKDSGEIVLDLCEPYIQSPAFCKETVVPRVKKRETERRGEDTERERQRRVNKTVQTAEVTEMSPQAKQCQEFRQPGEAGKEAWNR